MEEKRKFSRWTYEKEGRVVVSAQGRAEEAEIMDVSAGGMRVCMGHSLGVGSTISGKVTVLPKIGPFFVKGKVVRETPRDNDFEASIEFEKVSTLPLEN